MSQKKTPQQLLKIISYVLGRRPDEFGLVTDADGYVKIKDLIKALNEEDGFGYVRKSHIDEILYTIPDPPIETADNRIRAKNSPFLTSPVPAKELPKLLFTCIRNKAHPVVLEKGILPGGSARIILSSERELAVRMGKRIDPDPVVLTVQVQKSADEGVVFYQAGEQLFLAEFIPSGCFSGPPLPKVKEEIKKQGMTHSDEIQKTPGSYIVNPSLLPDKKKEFFRDRKKKNIAREKDRKSRRIQKQKMHGDFTDKD